MPYYIAVYDWSLYTTPAALSTARLEGDTQPNSPSNPGYDPGIASWLGETFTFNGGASTQIAINDDDGSFEDGYVETGGAATLAADVTINGTTYLAGSVIENEFSMLDASGNEVWVLRIGGVNVGFVYPEGAEPASGETFTGATARDGDPTESDDGVGSAEPYNLLICFTEGARIATPGGPRAVETLKPGERVTTVDDGPQPIVWTSKRRQIFQPGSREARPVEIKAGALAPDLPRRDIVVSPQHRFVFNDRRGGHDREVFVAAKALTVLPGIRAMSGKRVVTYFHFVLPRHAVVLAEDVLTESCYVGPHVLATATAGTRARIRAAHHGIEPGAGEGYGRTARPVIRVRDARHLLLSGQLVYDRGSVSGGPLTRPRVCA